MEEEATDDAAPAEVGEAEALELSPSGRAAVLHRIRMLMEYWAITPEELEGDDAQAACAPPPLLEAMPIKYRHPVSGETWDGQGTHPQWLRDALLKEGFTVDQLRSAAMLN